MPSDLLEGLTVFSWRNWNVGGSHTGGPVRFPSVVTNQLTWARRQSCGSVLWYWSHKAGFCYSTCHRAGGNQPIVRALNLLKHDPPWDPHVTTPSLVRTMTGWYGLKWKFGKNVFLACEPVDLSNQTIAFGLLRWQRMMIQGGRLPSLHILYCFSARSYSALLTLVTILYLLTSCWTVFCMGSVGSW